MDEQLIVQYLKAMTSLYGVISEANALEIINNQNKEQVTEADLAALDLDGTFVEREDDLFVHEALYIDDSLGELLEAQGDKPYYVPDKAQLLKYGELLYVERPQAYVDLKDFIVQEFAVSDTKAEGICEDLQLSASMGDVSMPSLLNEFQRRKIRFSGAEQINRLLRRISEMINHTRRWDNRGFTPHELFEQFEKPNLLPLPGMPFDFGNENSEKWSGDEASFDEWQDDELSEEEDLLLNYIRALVNLYGAVPKAKVLEIFNKQNDLDWTLDDLDTLIDSLEMEEEYFTDAGDQFVEESLLMDEDSLPRLLSRQEGKPYYIPEREELLRYSDDCYQERPPAFARLQLYIQKQLFLDLVQAEEICEDILFDLSGHDYSIEFLLFEFERREIQFSDASQQRETVRLILDLANHTRTWANRGFTPAEIQNRAEHEKAALQLRKAGRNDPCPCGSGKKYKQCCGRS